MNNQEMKDWVDGATYEQLLNKWRFAPAGDPFFGIEVGPYFEARMRELRDEDPDEHVRASKSIGW